ncbi:MAG: Crp/Fnr family transcriptional regulator [Clostridia bacterium]|nr:Crp/Fnr family transcriptional regulator [Clostridia bacterium]
MKSVINDLGRCPLFAGVNEADLAALLQCLGAREMTFSKGETILREGVPATDVGILISGQAQVIRTDYYGNRSIMMHIGPGQLFAEAFACARAKKLPVNVVATEASRILLLDCGRIMTSCCNACAFHNQIIYNLLQIVSEKNLSLHRRAMINAKRTTREKVMAYLLLQAKEANRAQFDIPFDRQGLADYLEVDRSGLSAELSKLKKEGVLDYFKNSFRLLHVPSALEDPSDQ